MKTRRTVGAMVVDGELAISTERGSRDERPTRYHARVADQVAAGSIVSRIHNYVVRKDQLERIRWGESLPVDVHLVSTASA